MSKKSIRFFNDREVRAVWDDENNSWWFSATDVVRAINDEPDYTKAGNYWRWPNWLELKQQLLEEHGTSEERIENLKRLFYIQTTALR